MADQNSNKNGADSKSIGESVRDSVRAQMSPGGDVRQGMQRDQDRTSYASDQGAGVGRSSQSVSDLPGGTSMNQKPTSLDEALHILDQAISRDGAKVSELITEEYSHLRQAFNDMIPELGSKLRSYSQQGFSGGQEIAKVVDTNVRQYPWLALGGVALGSFAIGMMLGRGAINRQTNSTDLSELEGLSNSRSSFGYDS